MALFIVLRLILIFIIAIERDRISEVDQLRAQAAIEIMINPSVIHNLTIIITLQNSD